MRLALIVISSLVIAVFGAVFLCTFTSRGWVEDKGRELILEKTTAATDRTAKLAETALESDLGGATLKESFRQRIRAELAAYRKDPRGFIDEMTTKSPDAAEVESPSNEDVEAAEEKKGRLAGFLSKVTSTMARVDWKEKIRQHYEESLNALIGELRIFSGSNVVAGLFGLLLSWKSRDTNANRRPLLMASIFLLLTLAVSLYFYISGFSVDIIFNRYAGWGYPITLFIIFAWLYFQVGLPLSKSKKEAA